LEYNLSKEKIIMKDINITVSAKASKIIGGVALVGLVAAIGFSYFEMSNMRRDLYAVRSDYYGLNWSSDGLADWSEGAQFNYQVSHELVSQNVKELRYVDEDSPAMYGENGAYIEQYKTAKIRILEVGITNNTNALYSYYPGVIAVVGDNGQINRGVSLHSDEDMNKSKTGIELAPGGTATVYVYVLDTGKEVEKLYDTAMSSEIGI